MGFKAGTYEINQLIHAGLLEIGDGYRAKNSELSSTGIPFARAANINNGFKFDNADFFPLDAIKGAGNKVSRPGDVVFTSKGTVGRFALVEEGTQQFVYSPQLCYWRSLAQNELLPDYLYYWMNSNEFLHQVSYLKGQTDMADYVSLRDQRKIKATIPDTAIQRAIVYILKPLDDRLVLLRETNTTLEAIAQALFKSWFVDFDPVRAKQEGREPEGMDAATAALFPEGFVESEVGLVPAGWRVGTIDQATSLIIDYRGKTPKKLGRDWANSGIPAVSARNIKRGRLVEKHAINFVDSDLFDIWMKDKLARGDILMTSEAPLGELLYLADNHNFCLSQRIFALRANPINCVSSFLYFWLSSGNAQERLKARATGTTVVGIRQSELRKVEVLLPPLSIQEKANDILSSILLKTEKNFIQAETLTDLRDTLLPRLISGQLRLPDAEALVEEAAA